MNKQNIALIVKYNQLKLLNNSDDVNLNILKLNLFSFIRRNNVVNINQYINYIVPKQKHILSIIKPNIIDLRVNLFKQKFLKRYLCYSIGYQINKYLLFIGIDKDYKIVYDEKFVLNSLNYRKIIYQMLSNNVEYVLIVNNLVNYNKKIDEKYKKYSKDFFNINSISDLKNIINASCIQIIDYLIIVKNKIYSFEQKR